MPENYGQMTQSTYLQIDACPARITAEENARKEATAFVASAGDTTDMSNTILSELQSKGVCNLGDGTYYVSGFEMPVGATLRGRGRSTVIRLLDSVEEGYCVRIHRNNTVENICFSGGAEAPEDIFTIDTDLGTRHGIYLVENSDGQGQEERDGSRVNLVRGCFFENFDGSGFFASNTGIGMDRGIIMADCYFTLCKVGINVAYYSEYSKFSNCSTYQCNVACINNGGNNVFTGCTFHGTKGFVIDNSGGSMTNNGHGIMTGCTINHINNMNTSPGGGVGVEINGVGLGFIFSDCQIWYSQISIANSQGIRFSGCCISDNSIQITVTGDSSRVDFADCSFSKAPTLTVTGGTRFDNCINLANGKLIGASMEEKFLVDNNRKNLFSTATNGATVGEVTFTKNNDGTWTTTATGATSARRYLLLTATLPADLPTGRYNISGCPAGGWSGGAAQYALYFYDITTNSRVTPNNDDFGLGNGFTFDWTPVSGHTYGIMLDVRKGANPNGLTWKPMLCYESAYAVSDAFVQKIPTTAELYAMIQALQ